METSALRDTVRRVMLSLNSRPSSHMDVLHIVLLALLGVVSYSHGQISGSELEVTARPGDNVTLYCDCKKSSGVYIVWFRNCSHENQPSLVLRYLKKQNENVYTLNPIPRFHFVVNDSSNSYDLMIMNVTDLDEGLYYCGTEQNKVYDNGKDKITRRVEFRYGNVTTRIKINSSETHHCDQDPPGDCDMCWMLLFSLCPSFAVLSSLLSSLVVYCLCNKKAKETQVDQRQPETRGLNQDEDVCYAALEIRQTSNRPKKKKTQSSDFSTYSAINTSRASRA
ncbi:uncharacterized protein LOC109137893 [Larimichthys crocea]|uniref:uncharacterized protein LOC109137893 n=1 Tax=Larimichthys crocea TaxID=215358 RepID=UPI000F5EE6B5|nr:uncharacterized protein LOC109137893 [Larimichthys crocea]